MATTKQVNKTRFAVCTRQGMEHIMEYFATEELSELGLAIQSFVDAEKQAGTNKERYFAGRMRTLIRLLT